MSALLTERDFEVSDGYFLSLVDGERPKQVDLDLDFLLVSHIFATLDFAACVINPPPPRKNPLTGYIKNSNNNITKSREDCIG